LAGAITDVQGDIPLFETTTARSKRNISMLNFIKSFRENESGAVTVDWVVLTAAIVGLGAAVLTSVSNGAEVMASNIEQELQTEIPTMAF
jgi:Flp pilus assembly pilin Flp